MSTSIRQSIRAQQAKLDSMPLTGSELSALSRVRSSLYTYGAMLGVLGGGCGLMLTGVAAPLSAKLFSALTFSSIGSFLGVSFGLQRGLVKLSSMDGQLAVELQQLDALNSMLGKAYSTNNNHATMMEAEMEKLFHKRQHRTES